MNCPVCHNAVVGRYCGTCGARVSANGLWAYRGDSPQAAGPPVHPGAVQSPAQYPYSSLGSPDAMPAHAPPGQIAYPPQQSPPYAYPSAAPGVYQTLPGAAPPTQKRKSGAGKVIGIGSGALIFVAVVIVAALAWQRTHKGTGTTTGSSTPAPTAVAPINRDFGPLVALQGTRLGQLKFVRKDGPLAGNTLLTAEVALNIRNAAGLQKFIENLYDPQSPSFHHFITPSQFAARFAPTAVDRANLAGWLAAQGLRVTAQSPNGLLIEARGTARTMNRAFHTHIDRYSDASGFSFYANSTLVHVPRDLQASVVDVEGLNDIGHVSGSVRATSRAHDSSSGFTPSELRAAYDLSPLYKSGLDGSNQTIALAEWGDFSQSDIDTYDHQFNLSTSRPERISVPFNGQEARPGPGQEEVELDIEVLHAIAPRAHVLVYVSRQTNGAGLAQANRIVSDDRASVVSVSWGFPDAFATEAVLVAIDQLLAEGAAQGQAVLVASGDSGAFDDPQAPTTPDVDYPSSDPFATAVGGTTLYAGSNGYQSESVWGNHSDKSGSGGGLSLYFKRPWYQAGPGVINQYSSAGTRQTPDVAAVADPNTGYSVYVTSKGQTGWAVFGGTSASTPLWAGYIALVQQKLGRQLGFLNPLLYTMGQQSQSLPAVPYHDVTTGDNLYYRATPGWDFGTGWGSMDGANMLQDIQQLESK